MIAKLGLPARHGAGVSDVKFRDENTVFAAGYDSMVRLYDLRSNKWYIFLMTTLFHSIVCFVSILLFYSVWDHFESYDSNIFSLLTDKNNAVILGTSQYGRVWLLDLRWRRPIREGNLLL